MNFSDIPRKEVAVNNRVIFYHQGLDIHGKRAIAIAMAKKAIGVVRNAEVKISRKDFVSSFLMDSSKSQYSFSRALENLEVASLSVIESGKTIHRYPWVVASTSDIMVDGKIEARTMTINPHLLAHLALHEDTSYTRYPLAWALAFGGSVKRWQFFEMLFCTGRKQTRRVNKVLTLNSEDFTTIFDVDGWPIFKDKIYKPAIAELAQLGIALGKVDTATGAHGKVKSVKFHYKFVIDGAAKNFDIANPSTRPKATKEQYAIHVMENSENPEVAQKAREMREILREEKKSFPSTSPEESEGRAFTARRLKLS